MLKMLTVNKNDAGQRLDKFLYKTFPKLTSPMVCKAVRQKDIRINGKRCEISTHLKEEDQIRLFLPEMFLEEKETVYDFLTASKKIDVVYEDENILLVNKPAGLLVHSDDKEFGDTLIGRVQRYLYEKKEYDPEDEKSFVPALANRIDRNTTGFVLAAKNAEALRVLNEKIKNREIQKYYLCLVLGKMQKSQDTLSGFLLKDSEKNIVKILPHPVPNGKSISTEYRVLDSNPELSLLEIHLLTGRTHQIRAHMASIGHPLLGDGKYGKNETNKRYNQSKQCLCAYKLIFDFTSDAGVLNGLKGKTFTLSNVFFAENGKICI